MVREEPRRRAGAHVGCIRECRFHPNSKEKASVQFKQDRARSKGAFLKDHSAECEPGSDAHKGNQRAGRGLLHHSGERNGRQDRMEAERHHQVPGDNPQDLVIGGGGRRGVQVDLWVYVCTVSCTEVSLSDLGKPEAGHGENVGFKIQL